MPELSIYQRQFQHIGPVLLMHWHTAGIDDDIALFQFSGFDQDFDDIINGLVRAREFVIVKSLHAPDQVERIEDVVLIGENKYFIVNRAIRGNLKSRIS